MSSLKEHKNTLSRDISWMYFNHRILQEAQRDSVPLLERLTFLGIYSNNLDEFFRVRVSTLKRVIECHQDQPDAPLRKEAITQLKRINRLSKEYRAEFEQTFVATCKALEREGLYLVNETQLSPEQANYIRMVYRTELNSDTYPLMTSQGALLTELNDSRIYMGVRLGRTPKERSKSGDSKADYAMIALPTKSFGRFIELPAEQGRSCIMFLDDAVRFCLPFIFSGLGYQSYEAYTFKFTRDAEIDLYSGIGEALIDQIARGVRNRKQGEPVRFIYDREMPEDLLKHIRTHLNIDKYDTVDGGSRYHNMKDLMSFPTCGRSELRFVAQPPVPLRHFDPYSSTLEMIRGRDYLLHYPFHGFSNYVRVLREAAISPDVQSIQTTVYRLAKDSKVVKALICAARNGKQVTVVVELLARFDESSNIDWAKKMQSAGIQVLFGLEGLKIHAKLTHIASTKGDVVCTSTGNFHEGNAKLYTDVTLMSAHSEIVREVASVFDYIRKPYKSPTFKHLMVSPMYMRERLYGLIEEEMRHLKEGRGGYILCKINHITDSGMIAKLYEASAAGVQMRFLVRGNCSIITGVKGVSEQVEVRGIIDRYLEHARILIFGGGGVERYYIGSADWMPRNLDNRVEVMIPIYDPAIQAELKRIVEYGLADNCSARVVDGSGVNEIYDNSQEEFRSQKQLYNYYQQTQNRE